MPADEVTHGTEVDKSRVRTGPRHAAPENPLFTRFHMPSGRAMALVAMSTAVLMGMGFTSSLAQADNNDAAKLTSKSLKVDEYDEYDEYADRYMDCVAALEDSEAVSASPSPSATSGADAEDCPAVSDEDGGVDNTVLVADEPWQLNAGSLLLKGADYKGVVEVKTASGNKKKVLKYVISDGTDIGDLHQTVNDKQSGKTYRVQAAEGSTSTIRDGETVMYTESISGNLYGLVPLTFDPEHPPPLNIPLIYFTNVKVTQAAQLGGTLHIPGMHVSTTD